MGRKRTIDRDATMNAVCAVVQRAGISGLSVEAVAKEAGISKSAVLYDFGSKNSLLEAFIRTRLDEWRSQTCAIAGTRSHDRNPWLLSLVEQYASVPSEDAISAALMLSAGMAGGPDCRQIMQEAFRDDLRRIEEEADNSRMATLLWLALNGLMSMECLGLHEFDPQTRERLLGDIGWLAASPPSPDSTSPSPQSAK